MTDPVLTKCQSREFLIRLTQDSEAFLMTCNNPGPNHGYLKAACTTRSMAILTNLGPNHGYLKAACTYDPLR